MRLSDLRGRSVAVWGTGREGRAAVTAIAAYGRPAGRRGRQRQLPLGALGGPLAAAGAVRHRRDTAFDRCTADVVVRSPGVPQTHPWMVQLRRRGVPVTGGTRAVDGRPRRPHLGVTGSKGKSTTSSLISHLLARSAGRTSSAATSGAAAGSAPGRAVRPLAVQLPVRRPGRIAPGGSGDLAVPRAPGRNGGERGVLPRQAEHPRPRAGDIVVQRHTISGSPTAAAAGRRYRPAARTPSTSPTGRTASPSTSATNRSSPAPRCGWSGGTTSAISVSPRDAAPRWGWTAWPSGDGLAAAVAGLPGAAAPAQRDRRPDRPDVR